MLISAHGLLGLVGVLSLVNNLQSAEQPSDISWSCVAAIATLLVLIVTELFASQFIKIWKLVKARSWKPAKTPKRVDEQPDLENPEIPTTRLEPTISKKLTNNKIISKLRLHQKPVVGGIRILGNRRRAREIGGTNQEISSSRLIYPEASYSTGQLRTLRQPSSSRILQLSETDLAGPSLDRRLAPRTSLSLNRSVSTNVFESLHSDKDSVIEKTPEEKT